MPTPPRERVTTTAHHPSCLAEQAWDVPEAYDHCSCPALWPRKVCTECWNMPHQHRRNCSRHPKASQFAIARLAKGVLR